jgi:secreted protein with Ig-like and vWFA domain
MSFDANDPRLTAYALDELDEAERAQVEKLLEQSPGARAAVEEIRQAAELLTGELASEPVATLTAQQRELVEQAMRESDVGLGASSESRGAADFSPRGAAQAEACGSSRQALSGALNVPKARRVRFLRRRWVPYAVAASIVLLVGVPLGSLLLPSLTRAREMAKRTAALEVTGGMPQHYVVEDIALAAPRDGKTRSDFSGYEKLSYAYQVAHGRRGRPGETLDARMPISADKGPYYQPGAPDLEGFWGPRISPSGVHDLSGVVIESRFGTPLYAADAALGCRLSSEAYDPVVHNPFLRVMQNPLSTFSIDVDTASYANVRRFLNGGQLPPPNAVRVEEFINYFEYDYPQPTTAETAVPPDCPFSVNVDVGECPWVPEHRLMRVGLKGMEIEQEERPSCNLVFLIDVSGSMQPPNKLPLLKQAMGMAVDGLNVDDRVALVVYAGSSGLVLPSTTGDSLEKIRDALEQLEAGGSTDGGEGIQLAYDVAAENFIEGGVNRVILATDGDFNVGVTDQSELVRLIEDRAKTGVFLSVLGFGMGNYKDDTLEKLADKGNGNYAYIDTPAEARKVLVEQLGGTLVTIAKDVKIQIEFNPAEVMAYRLIGYENRLLAAQDFNDDTKDAGEIGAGHTVTALYELVPVGVEPPAGDQLEREPAPDDEPREAGAGCESRTSGGETGDVLEEPAATSEADPNAAAADGALTPDPHALAEADTLPNVIENEWVDPLKYQTPGNLAPSLLGVSDGEVATVKLRYKQPDGDVSQLLEVAVVDDGATLAETSRDFRFAASVASFGMLLRHSPYIGEWTFDAVRELAAEAVGDDADEYRIEFLGLVERANELAGE